MIDGIVLLLFFAFVAGASVRFWQHLIGWRWDSAGGNYIDGGAPLSQVGNWLLALSKRPNYSVAKWHKPIGGCTICTLFHAANVAYLAWLCAIPLSLGLWWCVGAWLAMQCAAFGLLHLVNDHQYQLELRKKATFEADEIDTNL